MSRDDAKAFAVVLAVVIGAVALGWWATWMDAHDCRNWVRTTCAEMREGVCVAWHLEDRACPEPKP